MARRYITAKFRQEDTRAYTYHYDGTLALKPGDAVKVPDPKGADGWKRVLVVALDVPKPDTSKFDTKEILGLVEPQQPDMLAAGDDADLDRERGA